MAKHRLTDTRVRTLKVSGRHADGEGLYLNISDSGTKSWILRYTLEGRASNIGLGAYPAVSLAEAREKAIAARAAIAKGEAVGSRSKAKGAASTHIVTFREAAERYIGAHEVEWSSAKHRQQWRNTIETYACAVIGEKSVAEVSTDDVLRILEPIWQTHPKTAGRLRGRIETILDWAKVRKLRDGENPAMWRGHLAHLLPVHRKIYSVRHHPALSWESIGTFFADLGKNSTIAARALEFTILTCVRTSEARLAEWGEFDMQKRIWTIPAERMKMRKIHRVPLTDAMIEVLQQLPRFENCDFVFPGPRTRKPLFTTAMAQLLNGMWPGITVHGFRSTFRDWAAECTHHSRDVVEMALAHQIESKVEEAYRRGDLLEKRRTLMQHWSTFCHTPSNVEQDADAVARKIIAFQRQST